MQRSISLIKELVELGLTSHDLDSIATTNAATLTAAGARGSLSPHALSPHASAGSFAAIKSALETQMQVMGRAPLLLNPGLVKSPVTSQAIERINIALQTTSLLERRKMPRRSLSWPCLVVINGAGHHMHCLDIGGHGVRVLGQDIPPAAIGDAAAIHIKKLGSLQCVVRNRGKHGLNLEFCLPLSPSERAMMAGILLGLSVEQDVMMSKARDLALCLTSLFEQGLEDRSLSAEALFDTGYARVEGTAPPQYTTRATGFYDTQLPPLLERVFSKDKDIVYAVATDRNGYTPVHNAPFSRPQRPGETEHNLVFCRNRRIYNDATTLRAARFSKAALVQTYPRDVPAQADRMVMDASAPVFVQGRRWGCAQIAFSVRES
jgi:methyl-accepting chemotaxis protein